MTWWCSASGQPWTWAWKAYPGVWLFVSFLLLGYMLARRATPAPLQPPARRPGWVLGGVFTVWLALDWPIGALGAGYLASLHAASWVMLSLIAPPLFLLGWPSASLERCARAPFLGPILRAAAHPLIAFVVFSTLLVATHLPTVVDGAMRSQMGALLIDLAWFGGGLVLWWPVLSPQPAVGRLSRPLKMGYLFLTTLPPILPAAFLIFSDYPLYAVYELAPRVVGLTAREDQQLAGLIMKLIGDLPLWLAFGIIFFRWAREDQAPGPSPPLASAGASSS